ncbi:biopolymer transporter ExbD [bacterium]|nr:biopolymer transporter ExbD [bacterium]
MRRVAQRNRVMSEINITPLTDVMMVLLVIFMVTTPLIMKASIDINLPKAHAKKAVTTAENLQITLTDENKIYLNGTIVKIGDIEQNLRHYFEAGSDPTVTVSADKNVPYGDAVRILDIARQAGAAKLVLAAEPLPVKALSEEIMQK